MPATVALVLLVLVTGLAPRSRRGAVTLVAAGVLWLVTNGPVEGPVLWVFSPGRGLTGADLAGLAAVLVAARWWVLAGRLAPNDDVRPHVTRPT